MLRQGVEGAVVDAGELMLAPGVADGPFGFGAAAAGGSATAPFDVVVVVPLVLAFFEVSGCVVCCAAAGIDVAASRTAAST